MLSLFRVLTYKVNGNANNVPGSQNVKLPSWVRLQQAGWNKSHHISPWPLPFWGYTSFNCTFSGFLWAFILVLPICLNTQEASLNHIPWSASGIWAFAIAVSSPTPLQFSSLDRYVLVKDLHSFLATWHPQRAWAVLTEPRNIQLG